MRFRSLRRGYDENRVGHIEIMARKRQEGISEDDAVTSLTQAMLTVFDPEEVAFMYALGVAAGAKKTRRRVH